MIKKTGATITALLFLASAQSFANENLTGVFVYPSETYSPECIKFCKENDARRAYMQYSYAKKGCIPVYKDAGINVILTHFPYKKVGELENDKISYAVKNWVIDCVGEKSLNEFDKFEIDEPHLGYGDWKKKALPDIEKDLVLRKMYKEKFGKEPVSQRSLGTASDWRNILAFRQNLYWERLSLVIEGFKKNYPEKGVELAVTPCSYESGPALGVDINLLNKGLSPDVHVLTDPYFQAFRRPLQWSGMIIRWFRNATNNRKIGGVIQYYDAITDSGWPSEGYMPLTPSQIDQQVFEYLMNGATDITAFPLGARIFPGKPEFQKHLGKSLQFVEKSKKFWVDTNAESQVGIYFSENTFRMHDMWGPWSRMTGLYGASFQTEWTYYALSTRHIPAEIISIAFNDEKGLLEKLRKYKVMILPDVKCVSPYEAECFKKYTEEGGCIVATGETSFLDQNGNAMKEAPLLDLMGIKSVSRGNEESIRFVKSSFVSALDDLITPIDGNAARLFREQADRHPQWLKDKCREKKFDGYDMKFAEKLPEASAIKVTPSTAEVLAVYPDNSAAITVNKFGKGKCIYIAPSDFTLFKGKVNDSLEEDGTLRADLHFMEKLLTACVGKKTFELEGAGGVEAACRKSADSRKIYIYLLNHSEKKAENVTLKFSDPAITKAIAFEQESCSATEIKADKTRFKIPPFKYGIIVEAETGK